jgi:hypothetical protein
MEPTKHASKRLRQRGLPKMDSLLSMLQQWGHSEVAPGGAERTIFGSKEYAQAVATLKHNIQQLDRIKGTVVIHHGPKVITVYKN